MIPRIRFSSLGPRKRPDIHKEPTKRDFWHPPKVGPWNQNVRSSCLCGWLSKLWPPLGPLNTRCRIIFRTQKGTMLLTTTHVLLLSYLIPYYTIPYYNRLYYIYHTNFGPGFLEPAQSPRTTSGRNRRRRALRARGPALFPGPALGWVLEIRRAWLIGYKALKGVIMGSSGIYRGLS